MEMGRSIAANILGGGYAAPALDQRSGRVLVGCAGAISPDFSGELVGQAVRIVAIRGAARWSMSDRGNGGFLRFSRRPNPLVARRYVARLGQGADLALFFGGCRLIASFRTGQRRAAGRGVASSLRAREGGGCDPLAGTRARYLPRRVRVTPRHGQRPASPRAALPCQPDQDRMGRTFTAANGVGGSGGSRAANPLGVKPRESLVRTGWGARRLCVPGGLRKPATLGGGRNRVN